MAISIHVKVIDMAISIHVEVSDAGVWHDSVKNHVKFTCAHRIRNKFSKVYLYNIINKRGKIEKKIAITLPSSLRTLHPRILDLKL
jgi:hypothetical protein